MIINTTQSWSILTNHAREIITLRLQELCRDNDRVSALVAVYNTTYQPTIIGYDDSESSNYNNNNSISMEENRIWIVDMSRQRMTEKTLNYLLQLSVSVQLKDFITQMAWGQNNPKKPIRSIRVRASSLSTSASRLNNPTNNNTPSRSIYTSQIPGVIPLRKTETRSIDQHHHHVRMQNNTLDTDDPNNIKKQRYPKLRSANDYNPCPSMHIAMRVPICKGYEMFTKDGKNVLIGIHNEWHRIERVSDAIRRGIMKGYNGNMIKDVIIVGKGVSINALQFIYHALCYDNKAVLASQWNMPIINESPTAIAAAAAVSTAANRLRMNFANVTGSGGSSTSSIHNNNDNNNRINFLGGMTGSNNNNNNRKRRIKFLTTIDPIAFANIVSDLDPASTIVISIALTGNEETAAATKTLKSWLLQSLSTTSGSGGGSVIGGSIGSGNNSINSSSSSNRSDYMLSKHMILVTGNDRIATMTNKPESVYIIPDHSRCEPFCNYTAITLLPLSIVFGWTIVDEYIKGGHDIDKHYIERNPRHNIPVLLALIDIWNTILTSTDNNNDQQQLNYISSSSQQQSNIQCLRTVTPFTEAFEYYPAFVGALESQVCSGVENRNDQELLSSDNSSSTSTKSVSSFIIDGKLDGTYDRSTFGGGVSHNAINSELIMSMNTQVEFQTSTSYNRSGSSFGRFMSMSSQGQQQNQKHHQKQQQQRMEDHVKATQDAAMCSVFAHADELAFGSQQQQQHNIGLAALRRFQPISSTRSMSSGAMSYDPIGNNNSYEVLNGSDGNRPSLLLLTGKLDAFACGQLIAICEHRAAVKARLLGLDPFVSRQQIGSAPRLERATDLQNELQKLIFGDDENIQTRGSRMTFDSDDNDDDPNNLMLSTKTILGLYASMVKEERQHSSKGA